MATILTKKKDTTGAPVAGDLTNSTGGAELAVNTADKRLYTKDSGGNVVEVGTNPGAAVTFTAGTVSLPAITTTGDVNTGIFFPAADTIAFTEGGAEAMRIDSSGNVGIGNSSPQAKLHVGSVTTAPGFGTTSEMTYISGATQPEFLVRQTTNSVVCSLYADSTGGSVRTATNHPLLFVTNNTERMRIDSSGNVLVGITSARANAGDVQVSKGISFPATQSASSDANTLDDYEEGTWTTTFSSPTNLTGTPGLDRATYTKIGRLVSISGRVTGYSVTTANTATSFVLTVPINMSSSTDNPAGSVYLAVGGVSYLGIVVDATSSNNNEIAVVIPSALVGSTGAATFNVSLVYITA